MVVKIAFEKSNLIDWGNGKYAICTLQLKTYIRGPWAARDEMTYIDFFIRKENTFLRNAYPKELLGNTSNPGSLE